MRLLVLAVLLVGADATGGWGGCYCNDRESGHAQPSVNQGVDSTMLYSGLNNRTVTFKVFDKRDDMHNFIVNGNGNDHGYTFAHNFANTSASAAQMTALWTTILDKAAPHVDVVYAAQHVGTRCAFYGGKDDLTGSKSRKTLDIYINVWYLDTENNQEFGIQQLTIKATFRSICTEEAVWFDVYMAGVDSDFAIVSSHTPYWEPASSGGLLWSVARQPPSTAFNMDNSGWQSHCLADWSSPAIHVRIVNATIEDLVTLWATDPSKPRLFTPTATNGAPSEMHSCLSNLQTWVHVLTPTATPTGTPTSTPAAPGQVEMAGYAAATADMITAALLDVYDASAFPNGGAEILSAAVVNVTSASEFLLRWTVQYRALSLRSPRAHTTLWTLCTNTSEDTLVFTPMNTTMLPTWAAMHVPVAHNKFPDRNCTWTAVQAVCSPVVKRLGDVYTGNWSDVTESQLGNASVVCPLPQLTVCPLTPEGPCDSNSSYTGELVRDAAMTGGVQMAAVIAAIVLLGVSLCWRPSAYTPVAAETSPPPQRRRRRRVKTVDRLHEDETEMATLTAAADTAVQQVAAAPTVAAAGFAVPDTSSGRSHHRPHKPAMAPQQQSPPPARPPTVKDARKARLRKTTPAV
jgi:hypothetical protein